MIRRFEKDNFSLTLNRSDKFKTTSVFISIAMPLKNNDITTNSIMPFVLLEELDSFSDEKSLTNKFLIFHGTDLKIDIFKSQSQHFFSYYIELPSESFLNADDYLMKLSTLFSQMLYNPKILDQKEVNKIDKAKNSLLSIHRDKEKAILPVLNQQLLEKMHHDSPYKAPCMGYCSEIKHITPDHILNTYYNMINNSKISMIISGETKNINIEEMLNLFKSKKMDYNYCKSTYTSNNLITQFENTPTDSTISYLSIGFKYKGTKKSSLSIAKVLNALLGRFPHSLLFKEIREKKRLCYFILSSVDSNTLDIVVNVITSKDKVNEVINNILMTLSNILNGNFSKDNLNKAKESTISLITKSLDTPLGAIDHIFQYIHNKNILDVNEQIREVNNITKRDISTAVKQWTIDKPYIIKG
ncbi:M16 family metallopeptidase [Staphylococcus felis]|uniref:M16 family metallopeptidase n=1 Tax=Staphylococcus felis TaxID=46127 RepID=UPI002480DBFA|nr:insulinase family protein [Staphylococcus felis]